MTAINGFSGWNSTSLSGDATPSARSPSSTFDPMLRLDDTVISLGCEYGKGIFLVLDTGRDGPDDVKITIHEDGSSTVSVNGVKYEFSREETQNLRVRVDDNDSVQIDDRRTGIEKVLIPNPIQVFTYPE